MLQRPSAHGAGCSEDCYLRVHACARMCILTRAHTHTLSLSFVSHHSREAVGAGVPLNQRRCITESNTQPSVLAGKSHPKAVPQRCPRQSRSPALGDSGSGNRGRHVSAAGSSCGVTQTGERPAGLHRHTRHGVGGAGPPALGICFFKAPTSVLNCS